VDKEHNWTPIYPGADVLQCAKCPTQIRLGGEAWQHRASNTELTWVDGSAPLACDGRESGTTEALEAELKTLSERIATDPLRFQQVRTELKRRRETRDEQPTPETNDERAEREGRAQRDLDKILTLKIIAMEAEQAKLVVEAELFKSQRDESAARLALLAKVIAASGLEKAVAVFNETAQVVAPAGDATLDAAAGVRQPLSHETASKIALTHMNKVGLFDEPPTWAIDAIVEASR
jgi:hypothetical protein